MSDPVQFPVYQPPQQPTQNPTSYFYPYITQELNAFRYGDGYDPRYPVYHQSRSVVILPPDHPDYPSVTRAMARQKAWEERQRVMKLNAQRRAEEARLSRVPQYDVHPLEHPVMVRYIPDVSNMRKVLSVRMPFFNVRI